jgi:hypothetical protein
MLYVAVVFGILGLALRRRETMVGSALVLIGLAVLDGALLSLPLLPAVRQAAVEREGPFLAAVRSLGARIFERAGKDIEPVRLGLLGRYDSNDASQLALAQARQAWALAGSPYGVRYAYDRSPDGSYTFRNQLVQDLLDDSLDWQRRLKWLRAAGVGGVITPNLPHGFPGLTLLAVESSIGIPEMLFRLDEPLPEIRRVSHVVWAVSADEAIARFEAADFDEAAAVVVEGPPQSLGSEGGSATVLSESADRLVVRTSGAATGLLFVARTFSETGRAWVDGQQVMLYPANVHLVALVVPAGDSEVHLQF